jgi:hypothetical protein
MKERTYNIRESATMKRAVLYLLLSTLALVAAPGLRPRADASNYTTHVEQADFSIGAALIPPDRVKKIPVPPAW